jgi:hypothetical protein
LAIEDLKAGRWEQKIIMLMHTFFFSLWITPACHKLLLLFWHWLVRGMITLNNACVQGFLKLCTSSPATTLWSDVVKNAFKSTVHNVDDLQKVLASYNSSAVSGSRGLAGLRACLRQAPQHHKNHFFKAIKTPPMIYITMGPRSLLSVATPRWWSWRNSNKNVMISWRRP